MRLGRGRPAHLTAQITDVVPNSGPAAGGTSVRISMTRVRSGATVTIGGASATVTGGSYGKDGYLDVTTPAGTAGARDVVVTDYHGTSTATGEFTYTGTALTAGTATASPGDTLVVLSWTPASGGTAPYEYDIYRSTTNGVKGSLHANNQTSPYTDTGLTNGTTYYYTPEVTDSAGSPATVDYTQVSATPTAPGAHNEPGGMTQLLYTNGTNKLYTSSVGTVSYGSKWLDNTYVEVVTDATNPGGSGSCIEKRTFIGDTEGWNGFATLNSYASPYNNGISEIYIRLIAKFSSNWQNHSSKAQKIIMFGGSYNASQDFVYMAWGTSTGVNIRLTPQVSVNAGVDGQQSDYLSSGAVDHGNWFTSELWMKAQSAPGASDGQIKMWLNGTLTVNQTTRQWWNSSATTAQATKFESFKSFLYWGGQPGDVKAVNDYVRIGELYVSGKL